MITREFGNIVRTYPDGSRQSYASNDPMFGTLDAIKSMQDGAVITNRMEANNFNQKITHLQISVDNGVAETAPPEPLMIVYDDDGNRTDVPFNPPLLKLRAKAAIPTNPGHGSGAAEIPIGTGALTAQEQRTMYNRISQLFHDKFPNQA